jgi:hypothetical protein
VFIKEMEWICQRCNHESSSKPHLLQHLRRKKPCTVSNIDKDIEVYIKELITKEYNDKTYDCNYCDKKFNDRGNKSRHMKICKKKDDAFINLQNQLAAIEKKLEKKINSNNNSGNFNNNNNNNNIVNTFNINLRNLGHENMAAVPEDFIRGCCMNLEFRSLFENLHCDPNFPENHNIRIKSSKKQQLEIYKDDKWKITPYKLGLNEVMMRLHHIFEAYFKNKRDNVLEDVGEDELQVMLDQLDEIGKLTKQTEDIKKDLLCAIEEHKIVLA